LATCSYFCRWDFLYIWSTYRFCLWRWRCGIHQSATTDPSKMRWLRRPEPPMSVSDACTTTYWVLCIGLHSVIELWLSINVAHFYISSGVFMALYPWAVHHIHNNSSSCGCLITIVCLETSKIRYSGNTNTGLWLCCKASRCAFVSVVVFEALRWPPYRGTGRLEAAACRHCCWRHSGRGCYRL
jgi:hypothetical protein